MIRRPPISPLSPSTTLSRSGRVRAAALPPRAVRRHGLGEGRPRRRAGAPGGPPPQRHGLACGARRRSEEHTSELQSRQYLVCRLLLEKKKKVSTRKRHELNN